jgi:hypothetical protein
MNIPRSDHLVRNLERILAGVIVVGVTATIGLTAFDPATGDVSTRALPTDGNAPRAPGLDVPTPAAPMTTPRAVDVDSAPRPIDIQASHYGEPYPSTF